MMPVAPMSVNGVVVVPVNGMIVVIVVIVVIAVVMGRSGCHRVKSGA
jgi:hypothetical protein